VTCDVRLFQVRVIEGTVGSDYGVAKINLAPCMRDRHLGSSLGLTDGSIIKVVVEGDGNRWTENAI